MNFKDKKVPVTELLFGLNLELTSEDKKQIAKLIESYFRKRINITNSSIENIAGGLLWIYSRINFLFQDDESWSQQSIAARLGIKPKTVSNIASKMMDALRIDYFDERFARKKVAEKDIRNNYIMTKSGFILHKDKVREMLIERMIKDASEQGVIEENDAKNMSEVIKDKTAVKNKNKQLGEYFK